ncbi:MAG: hypothetical protein ACYCQJ_13210 [Nitrososphaerales archaeon]
MGNYLTLFTKTEETHVEEIEHDSDDSEEVVEPTTSKTASFNKPLQFRPEFAEFFSQDIFGPQVLGTVSTVNGIRKATDLELTEDPLVNVLSFPHRQIDGFDNPTFAIAPVTTITGLISLHLFRSNALKYGSSDGILRHFSASIRMKTRLRWLMELTIERDAQRALREGADQAEVEVAVHRARESLDNAHVNDSGPIEVSVRGDRKRGIFNANFFKFVTLTRLVCNATVEGSRVLDVSPDVQAELDRQADLVFLACQYRKVQDRHNRQADLIFQQRKVQEKNLLGKTT